MSASLSEYGADYPTLLLKQREQQMLGLDLLLPVLLGDMLRVLNGVLSFDRKLVQSHILTSLCPTSRYLGR